jgi:septum formation protein
MQPLRWIPENRLILASASPQRTQILHQLRIPHEVRPTEAPELESGEPFALAAENARRKGRAGRDALGVAESAVAVVLACDTVVALEGRVYGKPQDAEEAASFLRDLQGRTHDVLGALAIAAPDGMIRERTDRTLVSFAALDEAQIAAYVATGEWQGRAGGYAIQGAGGALVDGIDGDYLNVVGLPVPALRALVQGLVPPF